MFMRRRGVGLLGIAAVAGVAHHAGSQSAQAQAQEQNQNQQLAELQQQNAALMAQQQAQAAPPPPAAAPAAAPQSDMMAQLKQFADLHAAGILTDEEFAAAKAKVLAGA